MQRRGGRTDGRSKVFGDLARHNKALGHAGAWGAPMADA
jgi:hypothetical protein